jgi:pre-rRNA-processing protein IPI3
VSCLAATPYHIISGSDDSDIHVWSLSQLLDLDAGEEHEPERSLPNHRAAIISVVASQDSNPDTSICVSASKDKSCIVWNYRTGDVLRSLLFPSFPLCVALDPASRALFSSCEDGSLYLVEFFAEKPLLGPSAEDASTVVQVASPFGMTPTDAGSASCLAVSYDGTQLLTGHPKGQILKWDVADNKTPVELANLNAAVTNLVFLSPLSETKLTSAPTIVKPAQAQRNYTLTTQFTTSLGTETRFDTLLNTPGFSQAVIENAIAALQQPTGESGKEQELAQQNEELWAIINEQRELQKQTLQKYVEAKAGRS